MLKFFTSLSFLYFIVIASLLIYGYIYYRDFKRSRFQKNRFCYLFLFIGTACLAFLWINIHAPLRLKTFSNLDHHFIQHDGYGFTRSIELGGSDTINYPHNSFSRFNFAAHGDTLFVKSEYSEEPFYLQVANRYHIVSANFSAAHKPLTFQIGSNEISLMAVGEDKFEMKIGNAAFTSAVKIKRGVTAWNLFGNNDDFINAPYYNEERIAEALKNVSFLRDDINGRTYGDLKFFISGRLFRFISKIKYDGAPLQPEDLHFRAALPDKSRVALGAGFLSNNRNQFEVTYPGKGSFALLNRYPVAYPLTEENRIDWEEHHVTRFLLADGHDLQQLPAALREGFLFSSPNSDKRFAFSPLLLDYQKSGKNSPMQVKAKDLATGQEIAIAEQKFILPANSGDFNWLFSIRNTFDWNFGSFSLSPKMWQAAIFGSLCVFILLVFFSSVIDNAAGRSWVWQLLSVVTIVLLTTRYFLYWRYKSFPPYEGMDLPSVQQLQSFSNFSVILFATLALAIVFGFGFILFLFRHVIKLAYRRRGTSINNGSPNIFSAPDVVKKLGIKPGLAYVAGSRKSFFIYWGLVLFAGALIATLNNFDAAICRRLAIILTIAWFVFVFISYKKSPLVQPVEKSWWRITTTNFFSIVISNPVKIMLSVSLLALFAFIDIGFAIVFVNFLIFNEAFLCVNYGIAGLSAGSKRNAAYFNMLGIGYLALFVLNLFFAPYIFKFLLNMPSFLFICGYGLFALGSGYLATRILPAFKKLERLIIAASVALVIFVIAFLFFPRERIIEKAAMTKYRIDVLTTPIDKCITTAYEEGKNYQPVIRAAQNQWFINTFIDEQNNPAVQRAGFNLLTHAPQNKGARYNAQATDLVSSRFLIAEHGKWSVLLYVLLLMLPGFMLASFYKLYPDFTNRTNTHYATITTAFSILNYLLITALLVILAATGRYIFFGQDLPFASILSKQSILFPALLIFAIVFLFRKIPQEQFANRKKAVPGTIVFVFLLLLLLFFKPSYNKNREFDVENIAKEMDGFIQLHLQPIMDYIDTSAHTAKFTLVKKDQLFADTIRKMIAAGFFKEDNKFHIAEITAYARSGLSRHLDQRHMLYLDLASGTPRLSVNDNYFRVEPPPHLQQLWTGNVFGDTSTLNISLWNAEKGNVFTQKIYAYNARANYSINENLAISVLSQNAGKNAKVIYLVNKSGTVIHVKHKAWLKDIDPGKALQVTNPCQLLIRDAAGESENVLTIEPDAFMKNYYVNGNRYYVYPLKDKFIWARNFAESISSQYTAITDVNRNAFVSFDFELMDSLSAKVERMMAGDTSYHAGAEYGISVADGNGRIIAMTDHIKKFKRPDPNDKPAFNKVIHGQNGFVSQSLLRKQIGNINLLRLNPGPGSTFKPIVFSAIASQLAWEWDGFAAEGFVEKQTHFGGERVPEYDFEKNNGRISRVSDYLKYSDNYYHSNVLLLGSYPKQDPRNLLSTYFSEQKPGAGLHWPYFTYTGRQYWLNGFQNWPAYSKGSADFGSDSSFTTLGLLNNFNIYTHTVSNKAFDMHFSSYDSALFRNAYRHSGFILPEYSLFDQHGEHVDHRIPYDLFTSCFRGHVKGSSQVMMSPVKMLEAYGRMITQSRNYHLTFNPYATQPSFVAFDIDKNIPYNSYLSVMRDDVFAGMQEALFSGTAARLGSMLKDASPYYYYAKTGTTGDDEVTTKSKLLTIIISDRDLTDANFNFRNNKFYTIYFTSQKGPAKQNEAFEAEVIKFLQESGVFKRYMDGQ